MVPKTLSPKMQDALDRIRANGGRVGYAINPCRAIGVNIRSVNALEDRGIVVRTFENGYTYTSLVTE